MYTLFTLLSLGCVVYLFNYYWCKSDPVNVMDYPRIKEQFAEEMEKKFAKRLPSQQTLKFDDCVE